MLLVMEARLLEARLSLALERDGGAPLEEGGKVLAEEARSLQESSHHRLVRRLRQVDKPQTVNKCPNWSRHCAVICRQDRTPRLSVFKHLKRQRRAKEVHFATPMCPQANAAEEVDKVAGQGIRQRLRAHQVINR